MTVLGQEPGVRPRGFATWAEAKAFWFRLLDYRIYADEVLRFHAAERRILIPIAPARTSKSYSAAYDVVPYGLHPTDPPTDVLGWVIGPTYKTNREFKELWRILVEERPKIEKHLGVAYELERAVNNPSAGDMEIRLIKQEEGGQKYRTTIIGQSADNEKSLQGEQLTFAIQSEAAEHPAHIHGKYLQTRTWRQILPTTPKAKAFQWLKRELIDAGRTDPAMQVESFEFPPEANPLYDFEMRAAAAARARRRAQMLIGPHATEEDDPEFAEQFLGRWVQYTGRVLPFSRQRNVIPNDRISLADCRIHVSCDYGYEDPSCSLLWAVHPNGCLVIADEVYERHLTTQAFVGRIAEMLDRHKVKPERVCGDPSRPEVERVLNEAGLKVFVFDKNAQRDRAAGYRRLQDLLVEGPSPGNPGLFVMERCVHTIEEWENLLFKEGFANEYSTSAIVGDDHAADAARYYAMTRPKAAHAETRDGDAEVARYVRERQRELSERRGYDAKRGILHAA